MSSSLCHCATCRKAHSASVVAWLTIERRQLQVLRGAASNFASSHDVLRSFCAGCGSPLFYANTAHSDTIDVATLALDHAERFPPSMEVWLQHRLTWQPCCQGLEHYACGSGGAHE